MEREKTLDSVTRICERLLEARVPRDGILVGIGGGVTLDVCGVAASLVRRGIAYVRIPTTLMGLIDVGVGIKSGVNFRGHKNYLGTFYPCHAVLNDPTFLETLSTVHLSEGLAEVVKIALVRDARLFAVLEEHGTSLLRARFRDTAGVGDWVIEHSIDAMEDELVGNYYERDLARKVDFGHTFSTTVEVHSEYQVSHGAAVAIDMALSSAIAVQLGLLSMVDFDRIVNLLSTFVLPTWYEPLDLRSCLNALAEARRHRSGNLNFVVPHGIGQTAFVQSVETSTLRESIRMLKERKEEFG